MLIQSDPFNMKTGGMVNMAVLKNTKHRPNDAYETGIGTQFNAETNKRDEDEEMYIDLFLLYIDIIEREFIYRYITS